MGRHRAMKIASDALHWFLLMILVVFSVFPVAYMFCSSFKRPVDIWAYPPRFLPAQTNLENYINVFREYPIFVQSLGNVAIIVVGTVALTMVCAFLAAFAFSRFQSKSRFGMRAAGLFLMVIRMFPPIVITIPIFPILNSLGLLDKHITMILMHTAFNVSLATWIMKTFIDEIPIALEEAALIDGCTRLQAFFKVILPLAAPGIIATIIFITVPVWNEYLFSMLFTSQQAITPPVVIAELIGSVLGIAWGALLAMSVMQLAPVLALVLFVQRGLVKGMTVGAVK
ncbi:MAG: carbohydrate ABC transporter permease [Limnochordia bacterium]|jgi:multiple sugar transport system permease protein